MIKTLAFKSLVLVAILSAATLAMAQNVRLRRNATIYYDAEGNSLNAPEGVAFDGASLLVVADTGNRRLLTFDISQDLAIPRLEIRLNEVSYPTQVHFDANQNILVLDGRQRRIVRIDQSGQFMDYLDLDPGDGTRDIWPKAFEVDASGNILILDSARSRVLVFGQAGNPLRDIPYPSEVGFVSDLAVGPDQAIYLLDSVDRRLWVARQGGAEFAALTEGLEVEMAFPTALAADSTANLFVVDHSGSGIVIVGRDGTFKGRQSSMGWGENFLRFPAGIAATGDSVFVADRGNNRVQWFQVLQ